LVALLEQQFDIKEWPLSGNGMLEVLDAVEPHLAERGGYSLDYGTHGKNKPPFHWVLMCPKNYTYEDIVSVEHPTSLPRAVAVAALLTMKEKK